jgi:hypothetical protein
MADNLEAFKSANDTVSVGTFATDDVGGVHYPKTKLAFGAADVATLVSSADPLPVTGAVTQSGAWTAIVTNAGTFAVQAACTNAGTFAVQESGTALTRLTAIQTAIEAVDTNTDSGAVVGNGLAATAQRVTLASDSTGTLAATQSGTWNITNVSGTISLPTGASTLTEQQSQTTQLSRLAAKYVDFDTGAGTDSVVALGLLLPGAGGAVIGGTSSNPIRIDPTGTTAQPITAASLPLPTGAASAANQATEITHLATLAGTVAGTEVQVDIVSSALPTGAASEASLAAAAASLNVVDDWDEADRAKVNLIVGQAGVAGGSGAVSATTQRMVLATDVALPTGTNSIGQVTANAGTNLNTSALALEATASSSLTVLNFIASAVQPTDVGHVNGDVGIPTLVVRDDALTTLTPIDGDYVPLRVTSQGALWSAIVGTDGSDHFHVRTDGNGRLMSVGNLAHAPDSGNPVKIGGQAVTSLPAAVATGDRVNAIFDEYGRAEVMTSQRQAEVSVSFNRPADTTAYAAGDSISDSTSAPSVLTFTGVARSNGQSGHILQARLIVATKPATPLEADLVLFHTTITPVNDNSVFSVNDTQARTVIGKISFAAANVVNLGANQTCYIANEVNIPFKCGSASTAIFGALVARNAYTPGNAETINVYLQVEQHG